MLKSYYVEFKTWAEGYVDIPWPWAKYEEIADYRLRADWKVAASPGKIRGLFTSMDEASCNRFLRNYVAALVMGVMLDLEDQTIAADVIKSVFGSCEIVGICEITDENRGHIASVMADAQQPSSAAIDTITSNATTT